jgi:23S rRNA pseudouridine1911/1915/1917 synthase
VASQSSYILVKLITHSPPRHSTLEGRPHWIVGVSDVGLRLDKFLAAADRLGSRGRATDAIARGKVFLNDDEAVAADSSRVLVAGDSIHVWMDRPGSAKRRSSPERLSGLRIIHEDDDLIVVDKPAGLLSVPLPRRTDASSVAEEIAQHLRLHRRGRPFVVHRIDRDTSGLVVVAKHAAAHAALKEQFLRHEPERAYQAVVYGRPSPASGTWSDRLVWDQKALIQKETHPRDPRGKEAVSEYRVLESFREASLIEVRLVTGKRNQIRIQARLRGHTLVGEQRYVYGPDLLRPIAFPRQALHAARLAFRHPATDRRVEFEAPLPEDLRELLERLRPKGRGR